MKQYAMWLRPWGDSYAAALFENPERRPDPCHGWPFEKSMCLWDMIEAKDWETAQGLCDVMLERITWADRVAEYNEKLRRWPSCAMAPIPEVEL